MGGWLAYFMLFVWMVIAHLASPSSSTIQHACGAHAHVVSYSNGGTFSGYGTVVCSDGRVLRIGG